MFKISNKNTRATSLTLWTLNIFCVFFYCFYRWLWEQVTISQESRNGLNRVSMSIMLNRVTGLCWFGFVLQTCNSFHLTRSLIGEGIEPFSKESLRMRVRDYHKKRCGFMEVAGVLFLRWKLTFFQLLSHLWSFFIQDCFDFRVRWLYIFIILTSNMCMLCTYSRVPNNRRGWNNSGVGHYNNY